MPSNPSLRPRTISHPARLLSADLPASLGLTGQETGSPSDASTLGTFRRRSDRSPSRRSISSSVTARNPFRSYFYRSIHDSIGDERSEDISESVRKDTADLADFALSDCTRNGQSPLQYQDDLDRGGDDASVIIKRLSRASPIEERPEPLSSTGSYQSQPHGQSALTKMIRDLPDSSSESSESETDSSYMNKRPVHRTPTTARGGIISQPTERSALLSQHRMREQYGPSSDVENNALEPPETHGLKARFISVCHRCARQLKFSPSANLKNGQSTTGHVLWKKARQPMQYVPSVVLGLLLNILDALSYGMILFPINEAPFAGLGPDGISMFYVSCIVSQLVYSLGGSIFKGGVGSEMIEVVPFFHKMAFTIRAQVGVENPRAVLATTILAYSLSSVMTGAVFFLMGQCKIGALIGFFPRHILLGCIGGVGLFLVQTGLEVSARLQGSFEYTAPTFQELIEPATLPLWITPLCLAILLLTLKRWVKHPLTDAAFFISIIAVFYFFELVIPQLSMPELRSRGWVFEAPVAGEPFYHFYTLYDFGAVDWKALVSTVPAMLALTFFGILHVPINIPALGVTTGEDNVDVDRELRAHGISNALSGFCGSIQNYLVYTNTVLFMRSGADSRVAGVMLAIATIGVLISGTAIIGFIPVMVVGSLIFFLGIELMREALFDTWGKLHRLEYLTILIIVVTMGAWDFVAGILLGIVLACVSFVLQTSQISAIRSKLYGGVANSTVRRHPVQQRFLQDAGRQICVMKLAGYLFFGTIVDVEKQIRNLLDEAFTMRPIRFLVLELFNVDGVDFSAAEAFTRLNRILEAKSVQFVICGMDLDSDVGKSLRTVGLFDKDDGVQYFHNLNSALEYCENELLKALYNRRDAEREREPNATRLEVPKLGKDGRRQSISMQASSPAAHMFGSPRQTHLHNIATIALREQQASLNFASDHPQPLQLLLQTFSAVSDQPEEFWIPAARYFKQRRFTAGEVLYRADEPADGFYLLESGMVQARYDLPQGRYAEIIVAGTTCGELPFFADTRRSATAVAERDTITWTLDRATWNQLQKEDTAVAEELLRIGLKLTSERMDAVTRYMLLTSG